MRSPKVGQSVADRGTGHALQVEGRVDCLEDIVLEFPQRVRVGVWDSDDAQVLRHPRGQGIFVDRGLLTSGRQNRTEGATEGRELVTTAEMHAGDSGPQRVLRALAARPPGCSCQARVDQARLQLDTQAM